MQLLTVPAFPRTQFRMTDCETPSRTATWESCSFFQLAPEQKPITVKSGYLYRFQTHRKGAKFAKSKSEGARSWNLIRWKRKTSIGYEPSSRVLYNFAFV